MRLLASASVSAAAAAGTPQTFAAAGARATATLVGAYYAGNGLWRQCNAADCASGNTDWGADSLTYTLALRFRATRDRTLLAPLQALVAMDALALDGPPPVTTSTAWQTNGGLALEIAVAALAPKTVVRTAAGWVAAHRVATDISTLPATLTFHGSGVVLYGTLGEQCCEPGHARVVVDGRETFDQTGIWQNKSSSGRSIANTVLFPWRWTTSGTHTLAFEPGIPNGKEGSPFLHLTGYAVLR